MFALLLKHQLWPTSLGQSHMLALLLTYQLWPSSGGVRPVLGLGCISIRSEKLLALGGNYEIKDYTLDILDYTSKFVKQSKSNFQFLYDALISNRIKETMGIIICGR